MYLGWTRISRISHIPAVGDLNRLISPFQRSNVRSFPFARKPILWPRNTSCLHLSKGTGEVLCSAYPTLGEFCYTDGQNDSYEEHCSKYNACQHFANIAEGLVLLH